MKGVFFVLFFLIGRILYVLPVEMPVRNLVILASPTWHLVIGVLCEADSKVGF